MISDLCTIAGSIQGGSRCCEDGGAELDAPAGRVAAQVVGRGGGLPAGLPERHDGLQPAATPALRPAHVPGVRVRLQRPDHGRRPVQRVRAGHRGPEAAVRGRPRVRVRGQPGPDRDRRVRVRAAHIPDGVAHPELDIRPIPVLLPAHAPGKRAKREVIRTRGAKNFKKRKNIFYFIL